MARDELQCCSYKTMFTGLVTIPVPSADVDERSLEDQYTALFVITWDRDVRKIHNASCSLWTLWLLLHTFIILKSISWPGFCGQVCFILRLCYTVLLAKILFVFKCYTRNDISVDHKVAILKMFWRPIWIHAENTCWWFWLIMYCTVVCWESAVMRIHFVRWAWIVILTWTTVFEHVM